jgi:hypothetical protein
VPHIESNLVAASIALAADQMTRFNEVSAPALSFSASLTQPMIRRMLFGG